MVSRNASLPAFRATAINGSLPLYFGFGSPRITGKYQVWLGEPRGIYARHPKWPRDVERNDTSNARSVGCGMKSAAPSEYGGYHWNAHMPCSHNFHLNGNEWQLPSALLDLQSQGGGAVALDRPHKHRALDSSLALSLSLSLTLIHLPLRKMRGTRSMLIAVQAHMRDANQVGGNCGVALEILTLTSMIEGSASCLLDVPSACRACP